MNKCLIFFGLLLNSWIVSAHQPDVSSTMLIDQGDNNWVLQIRASLTAFQHEIKLNYPDETYASPEEFQAMVMQHLKENIEIRFNDGEAAMLQNGQVKIGHETSVVFEVLGVPGKFNTLTVENRSFKDIHKNQSALIIFKEGFAKEQFILNDENQHIARLAIAGNRFELLTPQATAQARFLGSPIVWVAIFGIGLLIPAYLWIKSRKALA